MSTSRVILSILLLKLRTFIYFLSCSLSKKVLSTTLKKMDLIFLQIWILRSKLGRHLFSIILGRWKTKNAFLWQIQRSTKGLQNTLVFEEMWQRIETYCFIDFKLNSFILAWFVDNILIWSTIENFVNICYLVVHFRF